MLRLEVKMLQRAICRGTGKGSWEIALGGDRIQCIPALPDPLSPAASLVSSHPVSPLSSPFHSLPAHSCHLWHLTFLGEQWALQLSSYCGAVPAFSLLPWHCSVCHWKAFYSCCSSAGTSRTHAHWRLQPIILGWKKLPVMLCRSCWSPALLLGLEVCKVTVSLVLPNKLKPQSNSVMKDP